jgi:RimK family alpha-L-glutamate ligase
MNKKKILVLTMSQSQSNYEVGRLVEEAEKLGVGINKALYRDLSFDLNNGKSRVLVKGEEITTENTLGAWFRVAGTKTGKYVEGRNLMIRLLENKVFCVNHEGYLNWPRMGKISQHGVFLVNEIPVVPTKIFYQKEQIPLNLSPFEDLRPLTRETFWKFPVICKHERGYQGKSVRKFNNEAEVKKFLDKKDEKYLGMYLWQKFLPTRWDIRVIVLQGKVIGAMKRSAVGEEFRSNYSLGGAVEKWQLAETDKELAEKVAKVCGLDYGGVDIMKDVNGESYVLEVNRQCQFQGFEKSTGINVAKKVAEMFLGYI